MDNKWITKALSGSGTAVEVTEELLQEKVVILLQGKNVFGDPIFSYLQLTLENLQNLKHKMMAGEQFLPAEYGTVVAAGKGEPSNELKSEMAVTYNMVDVPTAAPKDTSPSFAKPGFWAEEDDGF